MPIEIQLPRLGWSMEEGTFLAWLKQPGDQIREGEPLFTLESDKAAQEVEAIDSGVLCLAPDAPKAGEVVKVGHVLGWLLAEGESAPAAPVVRPPESPAACAFPAAPVPDPSAKQPAAMRKEAIPASPRARRTAREHGVNIAAIAPSGRGGRVCERDVLAAGREAPPAHSVVFPGPVREIPVTPRRRAIAVRLGQSRQETVPVTLTCRVDAEAMLTMRQQLKAGGKAELLSAVPTINDILVKFTAVALRTHPMLAGVWAGDRILIPESLHIGIAVDTPDGLLVPVLRDPATATLTAIAVESRRLIADARAGTLAGADMQGGCFTLSNLGSFGIETFTPVINPPETAILGVGTLVEEAVRQADGSWSGCRRLPLSLTFDHRVIDGAPAARFLQTLRQLLEHPILGLA